MIFILLCIEQFPRRLWIYSTISPASVYILVLTNMLLTHITSLAHLFFIGSQAVI